MRPIHYIVLSLAVVLMVVLTAVMLWFTGHTKTEQCTMLGGKYVQSRAYPSLSGCGLFID